ncbi:efflux RND transporter permease subunit, partial [Acinetobacter baumannii]
VIQALSNANNNVGGRAVSVGDQSVNVRGLGLMRDIQDFGNTVLSQQNGQPVLVRDVAEISVGHVPRLGEAGRDASDDVVTGVVVMNRTLQT